MEFKLNELHRNVPDEDLINDIKYVAMNLRVDSISTKQYREFGKYNYGTILKRFGSWAKALDIAGLKSEGHVQKISDENYLEDLRTVATSLNNETVKTGEYALYGKYDVTSILRRFETWNNALLSAGLKETGYIRSVSKTELLEEIERLWISLGRQPTTTDIKLGKSKYSLNSFARHFGSWRKALEYFVEYVNNDKVEKQQNEEKLNESNETVDTIPKTYEHKTNRDINLRLRFLVMKRDNFKCCICGASPAKDPTIELHIDHVIPWSKGGETNIDNLQTLCSKYNLGKSDII